jgi:DNA-binding NarL/FixJ family response regulator
MLDLIAEPAFFVTGGDVVLYANRIARGTTLSAESAAGHFERILLGHSRCCGVEVFFERRLDHDTAGWARRHKLSPRFAELAAFIADGCSDKEIADRMRLSFNTVRTYVRQLYRMSGVHNRVELVRAMHRD